MAAQFLCRFAKGRAKNVEKVLILPAKGMGSTQEVRVAGVCDGLAEGLPGLNKSDFQIAPPGLSIHDGYRATKESLKNNSPNNKILIAAMVDPLAVGSCL